MDAGVDGPAHLAVIAEAAMLLEEVAQNRGPALNIEVVAGLKKGDKVVERPPKEIS